MAEQNKGNNYSLRALGGLLLFVLGIVAFNAAVITSFSTVYVLGWILIIGGIVGFIVSFAIPGAGGIIMGIVSSILSLVLGALMILNPGASLATLTLLVAMYFIVDGIIRIAVSFTGRDEYRGWSIFYGIVALILGVAVWRHWPEASLYFFGVFIGIVLAIRGLITVATSFGEMQIAHRARYT